MRGGIKVAGVVAASDSTGVKVSYWPAADALDTKPEHLRKERLRTGQLVDRKPNPARIARAMPSAFNHSASSAVLPPPVRAQQVMIELADGFDSLLHFLVIGEPAAHFLDPLTAHADLTRTVARIRHRQHEDLVVFPTRAFWASRAVSGDALQ
jgi:hypothetical protein